MGMTGSIHDQQVKDAVYSCGLFNRLPRTKVDEILTGSRLICLDESEILAQQGEPATEFFLLLDGELKLATTSSMGQEKTLHIIHAGQTFAEVLMFLDRPCYPAAVTALVKSRLVAFPNDTYRAVLSKSTEACFGLLGEYALRNRSLVGEIEALTLYNASFRVVQYLLKEIPSHQVHSTSVELRAPKNVIASRLAITPETLSRILAKLKRDGVIEVSDKRIILKDLEWMRKFMAQA